MWGRPGLAPDFPRDDNHEFCRIRIICIEQWEDALFSGISLLLYQIIFYVTFASNLFVCG